MHVNGHLLLSLSLASTYLGCYKLMNYTVLWCFLNINMYRPGSFKFIENKGSGINERCWGVYQKIKLVSLYFNFKNSLKCTSGGDSETMHCFTQWQSMSVPLMCFVTAYLYCISSSSHVSFLIAGFFLNTYNIKGVSVFFCCFLLPEKSPTKY